MVKLERVGDTAPGVNRYAEVEDADAQNWIDTGAWQVIGKGPKAAGKTAKADQEPEHAGNVNGSISVDQAVKRSRGAGGKAKAPRRRRARPSAAEG